MTKKVKPKVKVTIGLCIKNCEATIKEALDSIKNQDYPHELIEVIVVDDGSIDGSRSIIKGFLSDDRVRAIFHETNLGKAKALSDGIRAARGDVIFFLDADTVLIGNDVIRRVIYRLYSSRDVGAVSGYVKIGGDQRKFIVRLQALEYFHSFILGRRIMSKMGWHMILPGALTAFRSIVVKTIWGVPTDTISEDFDLSMICIRRGFRTLHESKAVAYTLPKPTLWSLYRQRLRWYLGGLQVLAKHKSLILNKWYGAAGLASFFYILLIEYSIPFLQLFGYIVFPILLLLRAVFGVSFPIPQLSTPVAFLTYATLIFVQPIPSYITVSYTHLTLPTTERV